MISYLVDSHRPNYTSTIFDELSRSQALLKCMYILCATFLVDNDAGLLVTGFQEALECLYL